MTRIRRSGSAALALALLVPAGGVVAQTPEPVERTAEMEARATELATWFPQTLAGVSLVEDLEISIGQELLAELDPSDPDDAVEIAQIEDIMVVAGVPIDDAATAVSLVQLDEGEFGFVAAFVIQGSDASLTLPLFVAAFQDDIGDVVIEEAQVGDVVVTSLSSAADPEGQPFILFARGDTTWLLSVPAEYLEEAVASLPDGETA